MPARFRARSRLLTQPARPYTLEDGSAYVLAEGVAADSIAAGTKVQVTFDDTSKAATAVTVVQ